LKSALQRISEWARAVKRDVLVVYLVARDPRVPWPVKLLAAAVAAYALSPIDLISEGTYHAQHNDPKCRL
jgi:uncharacterized membrane protein YkvA (DUF1232 family)